MDNRDTKNPGVCIVKVFVDLLYQESYANSLSVCWLNSRLSKNVWHRSSTLLSLEIVSYIGWVISTWSIGCLKNVGAALSNCEEHSIKCLQSLTEILSRVFRLWLVAKSNGPCIRMAGSVSWIHSRYDTKFLSSAICSEYWDGWMIWYEVERVLWELDRWYSNQKRRSRISKAESRWCSMKNSTRNLPFWIQAGFFWRDPRKSTRTSFHSLRRWLRCWE